MARTHIKNDEHLVAIEFFSPTKRIRRDTNRWSVTVAISLLALITVGCDEVWWECPHPTRLTRNEMRKCFGTSANWQDAASHESNGKLYYVMWQDHSYDTEQNIINWVPDDEWNREVAILEQSSSEPGTTRPDDRVVYYIKLYCLYEKSLLLSDELHTSTIREKGTRPISKVPITCDSWPDTIQWKRGDVVQESCYTSRFCELGTVCRVGQLSNECPPEGSVCLKPSDPTPGENETGFLECESSDPCERITYNPETEEREQYHMDCADDLSCTDDTCNLDTDECEHHLVDGCLIDEQCVETGANNPDDETLFCNPDQSTSEWTLTDDVNGLPSQ